jgi:peptidyl-Lys metalloendopeptidase
MVSMTRAMLLSCLASCLVACAIPDDEAGDLQVELRGVGDRVEVTITNHSDEALHLLRHYLPGTGAKEQLFELTRDGAPVSYLGPHYTRLPPTERDYVVLQPGEGVRELAALDDYDLGVTGRYSIRYAVDPALLLAPDESDHRTVATRPIELELEGRLRVKPFVAAATCSASKLSQFEAARLNARDYSLNALNYMTNVSPMGIRYTRWFGTAENSRVSRVRRVFASMFNLATFPNNLTPICVTQCDPDVLAFVYAPIEFEVNLCPTYWALPALYTPARASKAGVLVHEMSHFVSVGDTDDLAYGPPASRALATSNPAAAIRNAENYALFAANAN